jgi:hypothetical protein
MAVGSRPGSNIVVEAVSKIGLDVVKGIPSNVEAIAIRYVRVDSDDIAAAI